MVWETRCFVPLSFGSLATIGSTQVFPLSCLPKATTSDAVHTALAELNRDEVEEREDIYLVLPGGLSRRAGLKLRNGKKAELKVAVSLAKTSSLATQRTTDSSSVVAAAEWVKFQGKLKHGFDKRKKMIEFLNEAAENFGSSSSGHDVVRDAIEWVANVSKVSLRTRRVAVSKKRRVSYLQGMCLEETDVTLSVVPPASAEDDDSDSEAKTIVAQTSRSRDIPSVSLRTWAVEGPDRGAIEAVGAHWISWLATARSDTMMAGVWSYSEVVHEYLQFVSNEFNGSKSHV